MTWDDAINLYWDNKAVGQYSGSNAESTFTVPDRTFFENRAVGQSLSSQTRNFVLDRVPAYSKGGFVNGGWVRDWNPSPNQPVQASSWATNPDNKNIFLVIGMIALVVVFTFGILKMFG